MKIIHFAEYASGGVATYIINLANSQSKNSNVDKIFIFCSKDHSGIFDSDFNSNKIKIIRYPYHRGLRGIFKILSMSKTIMSINPDIVHLHSTFAGLIRIKFLFSKKKNKIIYCAHGWSFVQRGSKVTKLIFKIIEKVLSYCCAKIINISEDEAKNASFIDSNKMTTIYNSVPDIVYSELSENHFPRKILFVGRLDFSKGIDLLIDAIADNEIGNSIYLTVVGDTVLNDQVLSRTKSKENIQFLGWRSSQEIIELLHDNDALIVPSRFEGFGLTALEAMRSSRMVIASNAGALPELIVNGENGLLFTQNSIQSLRAALAQFKTMSFEEIKHFGINGRQKYSKKFGYDQMIEKISVLYQDVIQDNVV